MGLLSRRHSPIGLDLGTHSFKAAQLDAAGRLAASVSLPRKAPGAPLAAEEMARLRGVLQRRGFRGDAVVLAIPDDALLTSVLELPPATPGLPIQQLATAEFARSHKVEIGQLCLSTWELPASDRASKATYLLGVGGKTAALEAQTDLVESAGLTVVGIDDPHSACVRGCVHGLPSIHGLAAVVDFGWRGSTLSIINDNVIFYTRDLADHGLDEVFREAEESLGVKADDVRHALWNTPISEADPDVLGILNRSVGLMLKEVKQALGYSAHLYPDAILRRIFLAGGGALAAGVAEQFDAALDVPCDSKRDEHGPLGDQMQAMGLALFRGVEP